VPDAAAAQIFVEGPPDWAPYRPEFKGEDGGKAAWTVKFSRLGATTPIEGATFRVTIAAGARAVEQTLDLD
jgi:DsbC/DsbD-like thiol-disulfide interchange protein